MILFVNIILNNSILCLCIKDTGERHDNIIHLPLQTYKTIASYVSTNYFNPN